MNLKRFVLFALIACLTLSLCACGGEAEPQQTAAPTETVAATDEAPIDDGKVTYTVKVVDEGGNPIAGAMVQLCKETCLPGVTGADGVAVFNVVEDSEYKVSFMSQPAGYEGMEEAYYFEAGSYELTITLTAVA